jgi:hypothetical protein
MNLATMLVEKNRIEARTEGPGHVSPWELQVAQLKVNIERIPD